MLDVLPLHLADVTLPEGHPRARETCPVLAHLIHHPQGAILVDTGMGEGHRGIDKLYQPNRYGLADALAAAGMTRKDVVAVINTHLHFDHCGANRLFPNVPIYVQRAEYEAAQEPLYSVREWVDFADATYRQVDGETEVVPGVRLLATQGHTPGHQSVLVEAGGERALIAGQAVYCAAEWSGRDTPIGEEWDDPAYVASLQKLRQLEPDCVYFSHDALVWERS